MDDKRYPNHRDIVRDILRSIKDGVDVEKGCQASSVRARSQNSSYIADQAACAEKKSCGELPGKPVRQAPDRDHEER